MSTSTVSWRYHPQRGVFDVVHHDDQPAADPSTLRALFDIDVSLYDRGCVAGMNDARRDRRDRRAYEAHKTLAFGQLRTAISRAFSEGYVAGFVAIASGTIA
jgi:hypothetical protein